MRRFFTLVLGAVALSAVPATAAAADEIEPSSDWSLDYADDSCALRRSFGEGEDRVWLEIRQLAPWTAARITIAAADFPRKRRKAVLDNAPTLRFLPAGTEERYGLVAFGEYGEGLQGLAIYAPIQVPVSAGDDAAPGISGQKVPEYLLEGKNFAAHSASTSAIELSGAFERDVVLRTGELQRPMEAMRACMDDLAKHWDVATANGVALSQPPVPRFLDRWAQPIMNSFPRGLLRFGGPVRIRARVIVGADGKPEDCRVIEPVVDTDYERRTCGTILNDGEYEPARDAAGEPVRELYIQNIVYVSPGAQRRPTIAR